MSILGGYFLTVGAIGVSDQASKKDSSSGDSVCNKETGDPTLAMLLLVLGTIEVIIGIATIAMFFNKSLCAASINVMNILVLIEVIFLVGWIIVASVQMSKTSEDCSKENALMYNSTMVAIVFMAVSVLIYGAQFAREKYGNSKEDETKFLKQFCKKIMG